ncbi:hypothetical protein [Mesotoga sp.]|uniref:hypothetical protein n=1 Tax=Mesotoga sp. TaxID=2053577 RepID=UPI00345EE384
MDKSERRAMEELLRLTGGRVNQTKANLLLLERELRKRREEREKFNNEQSDEGWMRERVPDEH